jgi:hypothetical protein
MTPSIVGYLCVNCGHAQRFYSNTEAALATPAHQIGTTPSNLSISNKTEPQIDPIRSKAQIKSTLKRLMVPELPEAHPHAPLPVGSSPQNVGSVAGMTPLAGAVGASNTTPAAAPNQSSNLSELQAALHPKQDTSLWVLIVLAVLMLAFAGVLLLIIIFQ